MKKLRNVHKVVLKCKISNFAITCAINPVNLNFIVISEVNTRNDT